MELVVISGLSGAGKSNVAATMEDMGYFVVDNMPAALIPRFAELCMAGQAKYEKAAVVIDIRGGQTFDGLFTALGELEQMDCAYQILFVEAATETIVTRYKETRRAHPLAQKGQMLEESIVRERTMLDPVRTRASYIVDTTGLTSARLRRDLTRIFQGDTAGKPMSVNVVSFGFKYGIPIEADLVFDVRFLPNPFYVPELKEHTGLEKPVYDFVFSNRQSEEFMTYLTQLMAFLLPQYTEEGKASLVIAVGCTGGQHRSVAVTRALTEFIRQKGYEASETHRDMTRGR
ncbi:MAG: RNase adapter RapZ [Oscillospiraceae bacterium]|nr:RNase adapter RapZ [Oscillospiraceae bacterium]